MHLRIILGLAVTLAAIPATIAVQRQHPLRQPEDIRGSRATKRAITPEVSVYAEKLLQKYQTPGLAVGVVQFDNGQVVNEFGSWGNKTEDGLKVSEETLFVIGSISKAFTASALGILMDDFANGRNVTSLPEDVTEFTWDTKIEHLLPKFWVTDDPWIVHGANIRDILSHVSGLYGHDYSYGISDSPVDLAARLRYLPSVYELRNQFSYNNQMFVLAGLIVETYADQSLPSFVKERIFDPLGMTSTSYDAVGADAAGLLSQPFALRDGVTRRIPLWFGPGNTQKLLAAAGGIVSNTIDMNKWIAMLLHEGVDPNTQKTVLPKSVYDTVTTAHSLVLGKGLFPSMSLIGYGFGWQRYSAQGHELITHAGGLPGFLSLITIFPNDHLGMISFVNQDTPAVNVEITNRIAVDILGLKSGVQSSESGTMSTGPAYVASGISNAHLFEANRRHLRLTSLKNQSVALETYAGTYSHPGYGSFTLCHSSSKDTECHDLISNYTKVFPSDDGPVLHASWDRVWFSHVRIKLHLDNPESLLQTASITTMTLFPEGYGQDTSPFANHFPMGGYDLPLPATFVEGEQGEITGLVWGMGFDTNAEPHILFSKQ